MHIQIESGFLINLNPGCMDVPEYFCPYLLQNTAIKCEAEEVVSRGSFSVDGMGGPRVSQKTDPQVFFQFVRSSKQMSKAF